MSKQRFGGLKHGPVKGPLRSKPKKMACGGKVTKMADGGPVYGAPTGTAAPGNTTRRRPRVGDKSGDTHLLNPKARTPSRPPRKKSSGHEGSVFRDYRGVNGVVDDAVKGK